MNPNSLRDLPSVSEVLLAQPLSGQAEAFPREQLLETIREQLTSLRERLQKGETLNGLLGPESVAQRVADRLTSDLRPRLRQVINATGIILHTNLGRAPVPEQAALAAYQAARGYLNLEMDLASGQRSSRQSAIRDWICILTGADAATAVNNNAAATVIALRALCAGKEVIIARGQLIEIGGSFRIPEVMAASGSILREVGTTNVDRLGDYENAIGPNTGALLCVHPSNYRIRGFTQSTSLAELASLARKHQLPLIHDIGSGALLDFMAYGFQDEPVARDSISAGADLVLFSADKLLGGPQAGILAGKRELIERIERDPLMRAFRLDKMTLASLETTLRIHLHSGRRESEIPVLRMLKISVPELRRRAEPLAARLRSLPGIASAELREDVAFIGGGSLPDQSIATLVVELEARDLGDAKLASALRSSNPPVIGRVRDGKVLLDLRTVFEEQEDLLVESVRQAVSTIS
jgi:L-seryl-tRNA(Ser) seleniumtransferase